MRASFFVWLCALFAAAAADGNTKSNETARVVVVSALDVTCIRQEGWLNNEVMRAKSQLTRVEVLLLQQCVPTEGKSYAEALSPFNVTMGMALDLRDVSLLPPAALRGAGDLEFFLATNNELAALPADLFAYSPKLERIELSDNSLETLPSGLFSKLPKLTVLILTNNKLTATSLTALAPLTALTELRIDRNPLGDHCQPGKDTSVLAPLKNLEYVDMSETQATRVCSDWVSSMRSLTRFNLAQNSINSISCSQLSGKAFFVNDSRIELNKNPLTHIDCLSTDYTSANSDNSIVFEKMELWLDRPAWCGCSLYWLIKTMNARHVQVVMSHNQNQPCENKFEDCEYAH